MKKHIHDVLAIFILFLTTIYQEAFSQGTNRVDVGKSFANLSKLSTGGTFNPGDTIEIRVTIAVIRQVTYTAVDSVQLFDVVPARTTYIPGSLRVATNQGLTYKGPFTEALDADQASNIGGNITINLGNKANGTKGGRIRSDTSKPSFFNSHCIMMACYQVRINPDAVNYSTIASVIAKNINEASYNFYDPEIITGNTYYRIKMINNDGLFKYSGIVLLSPSLAFEVRPIKNPFRNNITTEVITPRDGYLNLSLFNNKGQLIKKTEAVAVKGINSITIENIKAPNGVYFLFVNFRNETIKIKLVKVN